MPSLITSAALIAGAASAAVAAPANIEHPTFSINQVENGLIMKSGPMAMMKAHHKYGMEVTPSQMQKAQAAAAQMGSVAANPTAYDVQYDCPVTAGNSKLNLDFDTGSSDLWVYSTLQPSSQRTGHNTYNPSTGTKKSGYTWKIAYYDMSGASGVVYSDKVVIGGVTATSQAVEAATSVSSSFVQDTDNDGLVGLAFSSINTVSPKQQLTFFDSVKSTLSKALFTATLKHGKPGSYDFGYIDSSKYTGSITYVPVDNSEGFWGFTAGGYSTGSAKPSGSIGDAIADTGTTLMLLPSSVTDSYWANVSDAYYDDDQMGYIFNCNDNLPNFNMVIGGTTFTVPGSYINFAPIDNTGKQCYGGIQAVKSGNPAIMGDIFLKTAFTVFDQTQSSPRLGFAKQA